MFNKSKTSRPMRPVGGKAGKGKPSGSIEQMLRAAVLAFCCGAGLCLLLMALFAVLLANTPLPLSMVRPMACAAAAMGVALSGTVFAGCVGRKLLLCGLGCGVFYAACQLVTAFAVHGAAFVQNGGVMLAVVLLMSGTLGGALAAVRAVH